MWFGTRNGLNRYDGNKIKVYKHIEGDENSISGNHITALTEDSQHRLWIGTMHGLSSLDLVSEKITTYDGDNQAALADGTRAILVDSRQRIWVGTANGLYILNPKNANFKKITLGGKIKGSAIASLYETCDHHICIGTASKGLFICTADFKRFAHYASGQIKDRISDNNISTIYEDNYSNLWLATKDGGVVKINPRSHQTQIFNSSNSCLTTNNIRDFAQDSNKLFVGTFEGLYLLNIKSNSISPVSDRNQEKGQLSHFSVYSLWADNNKGLWVGTYSGGVNYYNRFNSRFTFHNPSLYFDKEIGIFGPAVSWGKDKMYFSTEGSGLLEYGITSGQYHCYYYAVSSPIHSRNIIKSLQVKDDNIWCGTADGDIYLFNPINKNFTRYFSENTTTSIYAFHHNQDGSMWIANSKGTMGLGYVTGDKQLRTTFNINGQGSRYSFPSLRCMLALSDELLLLGSRSNGLIRYDVKRGTITTYNSDLQGSNHIASNYITSITRDSKGRIWIGTFGGGFYQYVDGKGITKNVTQAEGLASDEVSMIVADHNATLWVSNGTFITSYNADGSIHNYSVETTGIQEFSPHSGGLSPAGDIFFSASNGIISFKPSNLQLNNSLPKIVFNDLTINNKPISPEENGIMSKVLDDVDRLDLKYNQNNIIISYCTLDYSGSKQSQYAYRLKGHDKDWNYVGNRQEAYYTDLSPGTYTFELKATNNDGIWNKDIRQLKIVITPPFWATWFAYLFYAFVFLGITALIMYYINKKRILEQELILEQREQQQREKFHEDKMRMYTSFSHELRTPLQLIISPLEELMHHNEFNLYVKNKLGLVYNNSQRLLLLVNQLMDLRKSSSGKMKIKVGQDDIYAFTNEIFTAFKHIAEDKNILLTYNQQENHQMAWYDKFLFEKVLFNLLSNALKYTHEGGNINISYRLSDRKKILQTYPKAAKDLAKEGCWLMLTVEDNGQGLPAKDLEHIFEPFYQAENARGAQAAGTGIGLSLTQSIVKLHHGTIWAENNKQGGATFTVVIPIDKDNYTPQDFAIDGACSVVNDVIPSSVNNMTINIEKKYNVLLVEDNDDVRKYISESLEPYYYVTEAYNGKAALDKVNENLPDIIVSDIMMPEMDGLELCHRIKDDMQTGHIPVILMTAKSMAEQVIEGYSIGADDYIVKPFNIDILIFRIKNILESRAKLREAYGKKFSPEALGISVVQSHDKFAQQFFEVIEQNISNPSLNVEFICNRIGVSRTNLYRKLQAVTELSPIELIRNKRLEIASKLLLESDSSIFDIAVDTGFSSQAYFSKCFKTVYGCTPSEFAEKNKAE